MSTEAEVRHDRRRRRAVITRSFVPLPGQQLGPIEFGNRQRSRELRKQAFDNGTEYFKKGCFEISSFVVPHSGDFALDHFPIDPASAPINSNGYQLMTLCWLICAEERVQVLDPLMRSKYIWDITQSSRSFFYCLFQFSVLAAAHHQMREGIASPGPHFPDFSDTSGNESEVSHPRQQVPSKRTYEMKRCGRADEVGRFFVTGATDAAGKLGHFFFRICLKDVDVDQRGT